MLVELVVVVVVLVRVVVVGRVRVLELRRVVSVVVVTVVVVLVEVVVDVEVVVVVVVVVAQNPASQTSISVMSLSETTEGGYAGMRPDPLRTYSVMFRLHWILGDNPPKPPVALAPWHTSHCAV